MNRILLSTVLALLLVAPLAPRAAANGKVDGLLADLTGQNERARFAARQLLPREGLAPLPKLLALLASEDAGISWAALRTVEDILNDAAAPGTPERQKRAAAMLLSHLESVEDAEQKRTVLRLLPIVVPEGLALDPVAALLGDAALRERARAALVEIGTTQAANALAAALDSADAEFQADILHGFVHMKGRDAVKVARKHLRSPDAAVRAAAALAVSKQGSIRLLPMLERVVENATPETTFEATDALLRLLDSIARAGGNYATVIPAYRAILANAGDPVLKAAALNGLGAYGDETVIADIVAAGSGPLAVHLEGPALNALDRQHGRAAAEALAAEYAKAAPGLQALLLQLFGRKQDAVYLPLLTAALDAPAPELRVAAVRGLGEAGSPEAAEALGAYAQRAQGAEKSVAVETLARAAARFAQSGAKAAAGRGYLALYRAADTDESRRIAVDGIKKFPTPDAFALLLNEFSIDELADMSVANIAALHQALADAGRGEEARKAEELLASRLVNTQAVNEIVAHARATGTADAWKDRLGFIRRWQVVGPFPFSMQEGFVHTPINEPNVDLAATYAGVGGTAAWKAVGGEDIGGIVDLMGPLGEAANACGYAYATFTAAAAGDAVLRIGSDDGVKAWLNGVVVHENNTDRGAALDSDQAPIQLKAGTNTLLLAISQGGGGWNFVVRLTTPDGAPLGVTQP